MRSLRMLVLASGLGCAVAPAADREFRDVVRAISDEFHTRPLHIPFFGLVNVVTYFVRPAGTRHIDLAVFENLSNHDRQGRRLAEAIRHAAGGSWKPFVEVRSNRGDEQVFVYLRQQGREWKLLIASVERRQATVVQLLLDPEALCRWLDSPTESARRRHFED